MSEPELVTRTEFAAELRTIRTKIKHILDLHDQRVESSQRALELQAAEIERRLAELNHERAREKEERARVLSTEKWEEWRVGYETWRETVTTYIAHQQGRLAVWGLVYGVVVLVASAFLSWLFSHL